VCRDKYNRVAISRFVNPVATSSAIPLCAEVRLSHPKGCPASTFRLTRPDVLVIDLDRRGAFAPASDGEDDGRLCSAVRVMR
jgi:hypothetical protein